MTERTWTTHDRRLAAGVADGLLREANLAEVLTAADLHVARRVAGLAGEHDDGVQLALALAVRAVRLGSTALDLTEVAARLDHPELTASWPDPLTWTDSVSASPLVAAGVLHVEHGLVALDRYRREELQVADELERRSRRRPALDTDRLESGLARVFADERYAEQRDAARRLAAHPVGILTGGPGTGKTTTVAGLLALLLEQAEGSARRPLVALAAPTGKAAARLGEAVAEASAALPEQDRARLGDLEASTLHRLLGTRPDSSTRFRRDRSNPLPHDIVVVDEASMLSLTMTARLLEALRPEARLVLVGDPDQLTSVDAGAVLADLVAGLGGGKDSPVAALRTSHRYGRLIGCLARAIQAGDAPLAVGVLDGTATGLCDDDPAQSETPPETPSTEPGTPGTTARPQVELLEVADADEAQEVLRTRLVGRAARLRETASHGTGDLRPQRERREEGGAATPLDVLGEHRLLCAHRDGPWGVRRWNQHVERWLSEITGDHLGESYVGRPVMVTANDPATGLYNGESGVVVATPGAPAAVFDTAGSPRVVPLARLADLETMHALTVHKSQGSQADEITVLLPEESALLTRELLYTAVTRARRTVTVVGTRAAITAAVERPVQRASGLRHRL